MASSSVVASCGKLPNFAEDQLGLAVSCGLNHLALALMPLHYRIRVSASSVRGSVEWTIFYPGSCVNVPATQSPVRVAMKSIILALVAAALTIGFGAAISPGSFFMGLPVIAALFLGVFLIQWVGFAIAWFLHTERYYDLTGSLTYIAVISLAWFMGDGPAPGAELLLIAVSVWAIRLGSFLFLRVLEVGEDQRFRHIKVLAPRFFMAWTLQGMWVSFTVSAVLVALLPGNAASDFLPAGLSRAVFVAGCCLAIVGLLFEVIADHQKARFRKNPEHKGRFIQTGLWSRCRHPNYFGEIVFWFGLALAASPAMSGAQHLAWLSPMFVYLLLTRLSGIPTLAKRGHQLWGGNPEYQAYLARTPKLVPKFMVAGEGSAR